MGMFSCKKDKAGFDDSDSDTKSTQPSVPPQPFGRNDILVIATSGKIYAVHKRHGSRLWRQKFPTGALGTVVSIFITDQEKLVVGSNGKTAAMDLFTGEILWVNKMKGCGYAEVGLTVTPSLAVQPTAESDALPAYCASTPSGPSRPVVISCTNGKCMGIALDSGEELWLFKCPKGGYNIPAALIDPPKDFHEAPNVFVGCGNMLYCLNARSGEVQWRTKFSNAKMGEGYTTMATLWGSRISAETAPTFNMFPVAQQVAAARKRAAAAAANS